MACDATARLYDVDDDQLVFTKSNVLKKYDISTIEFQARPGKLVQLDKLHESIWATRLSGGTRSGLVKIEVTVVGRAAREGDRTVFHVEGSPETFVLDRDKELEGEQGEPVFTRLLQAVLAGQQVTRVVGRLDGWSGRWPTLLQKLPPKPRRILVSEFIAENP